MEVLQRFVEYIRLVHNNDLAVLHNSERAAQLKRRLNDAGSPHLETRQNVEVVQVYEITANYISDHDEHPFFTGECRGAHVSLHIYFLGGRYCPLR